MTTWLLMQWELLSTADHRYKERTSINVDLERIYDWTKRTTERSQPLDNQTVVLSGDNGGRDCERWRESRDPIVIEKTEGVYNSVDLVL